MPYLTVPITEMNLDAAGSPGDHMWVVANLFKTGAGYELTPYFSNAVSFGSGTAPQGAFFWAGAGDKRIFTALQNSIWEISLAASANDMSGASYTNSTYGVTFASFGEYCYASNGVDKIQTLRVPSSVGSSTNFSDMQYTTNGAQIKPKYICSHKNHLIGGNITMASSFGTISTYTTSVGAAFTNQPSGDSVQVVSSSGADTTQTSTIYGTRVGQGDTVFFDTVALNGGTAATFPTYSNWDKILGVKLSASCAGTVTWRELSGAATITTLGTGNTSKGVEQPTRFLAGDALVTVVADGATTKQIGFDGATNLTTIQYDSQALTGTTAVQSNERYKTITEIFTGDLESSRTVTVTAYQYNSGVNFPYLLWISGTDLPEGWGTPAHAPQIVGSDAYQLFDGAGEITGVADGGDCFFVFKSGSIYRFDGPPFQPTVISHTVGMPALCVPYRQRDRVYFWGADGLCYIDIRTNQIVNLFKGRMIRSVTDYANLNYGLDVGLFPGRDGSIGLNMVHQEGNRISISGDSKYGWVMVAGDNPSAGDCLFVYQADEDCFFMLGDATAGAAKLLVEVKDLSVAPFPGSAVNMIVDSGAQNQMHKMTIAGLFDRGSTVITPYVCTPFLRFSAKDSKGKIVRVRPIFNNATINFENMPYGNTSAIVLSFSGVGKSWATETIVTESSAVSKDGWYGVPDCPVADMHAIVFQFQDDTAGGIGADPSASYVANFTGLEVQVTQEMERSK